MSKKPNRLQIQSNQYQIHEDQVGQNANQAMKDTLQIPDRSLQISQQQVNIAVQSNNLIDANVNPELVREYVEPPADHFRKIIFTLVNIFVLYAFFPRQGYTEKENEVHIKIMRNYFIISSITVIVSLAFYFLVKPKRIMKYADYFILLNVHKTNPCLNIIIGYLLSDFGIIMTFIAFFFLIANAFKIYQQNSEQEKRRKAYESKANKLIASQSNTRYSELSSNTESSKKQMIQGQFQQVEMK